MHVDKLAGSKPKFVFFLIVSEFAAPIPTAFPLYLFMRNLTSLFLLDSAAFCI